MHVCLIRHASTSWNEDGRIQGQTDIPLSPTGRAQVEAWRLPIGFADAVCVASPLRRAWETAKLLGLTRVTCDPRLAEMRWGEFEGRTLSGLRAEIGPHLADHEAMGIDFRPPGGESPREVSARLGEFLAERANGEHDLLLVTHKGVLRASLVLSLGWDMLAKPPVRYDPERALVYRLDPTGRLVFLETVPLREADP